MNKNCPQCNGWGWYIAEMVAYGKRGAFSRPCPDCNPEEFAKWKEAGDKGKANFARFETLKR